MSAENEIYADLSADQWEAVLVNAEGNEKAMFVLRNWAMGQTVSAFSISAFAGEVVDQAGANLAGSKTIGQITKLVQKVTGKDEARSYIWNSAVGCWSTGAYNAENLRRAFRARAS